MLANKTIKMMTLAGSLILSSYAIGETLRFGVDANYPPFEYKNPDGSLGGFDIDLGEAICDELDVECVWVENSFDGMIPALKVQKFDAILSALSITEQRKQEIAFSNMLYNTPGFLVAEKGSSLTDKPEDLAGNEVGVIQGSVFETYAKEYWQPEGVQITSYEDSEQAYTDLVFGRLDAVLDDGVVLQQAFLDKPQGAGFEFVGDRVYDEEIFGPGTGIGLRKESTELKERINAAISAIREDGTYDELASKYFEFDVYSFE